MAKGWRVLENKVNEKQASKTVFRHVKLLSSLPYRYSSTFINYALQNPYLTVIFLIWMILAFFSYWKKLHVISLFLWESKHAGGGFFTLSGVLHPFPFKVAAVCLNIAIPLGYNTSQGNGLPLAFREIAQSVCSYLCKLLTPGCIEATEREEYLSTQNSNRQWQYQDCLIQNPSC